MTVYHHTYYATVTLKCRHLALTWPYTEVGRFMRVHLGRVERALDIRPIRGQARSGAQKAVRYVCHTTGWSQYSTLIIVTHGRGQSSTGGNIPSMCWAVT